MDRRPPIILDDPFVTFDDDRARRALELLKEVATEQGFQVLLLTCSDRFDALADALIVLDEPSAVPNPAPAALDVVLDEPLDGPDPMFDGPSVVPDPAPAAPDLVLDEPIAALDLVLDEPSAVPNLAPEEPTTVPNAVPAEPDPVLALADPVTGVVDPFRLAGPPRG